MIKALIQSVIDPYVRQGEKSVRNVCMLCCISMAFREHNGADDGISTKPNLGRQPNEESWAVCLTMREKEMLDERGK